MTDGEALLQAIIGPDNALLPRNATKRVGGGAGRSGIAEERLVRFRQVHADSTVHLRGAGSWAGLKTPSTN
jgi:hypothetical protein